MSRSLILAALGFAAIGLAVRPATARADDAMPLEVPASSAAPAAPAAPPAPAAPTAPAPEPDVAARPTDEPLEATPPAMAEAQTPPTTLATRPPRGDEPLFDVSHSPATDDPPITPAVEASDLTMADDPGDQGVGAALGLATGGRTTAGGFRVTGQYTYQMSSTDWFDGTASFTFGGGEAACFRDREDMLLCDHGFVDGDSVELAAGVRRYFAPQGQFRPFARLAVGVALVRFGEDDITGVAVPIHVGGGLRVRVTKTVAIVAFGEVMFGLARFRDLGTEPQAGFAVTAGAEFRLK